MTIKDIAKFLLLSTTIAANANAQQQDTVDSNRDIDATVTLLGCSADEHRVSMKLASNVKPSSWDESNQEIEKAFLEEIVPLIPKFKGIIGSKDIHEVMFIASRFNDATKRADPLVKFVKEEIPFAGKRLQENIEKIDNLAQISYVFRLSGMDFSALPSNDCFSSSNEEKSPQQHSWRDFSNEDDGVSF